MKPAPTLEDVARHASVSTATVSRCLNSPDVVGEKTRKRVMESIQALGYEPNFGARFMAAGKTRTIGAVIPTMENSIFAKCLQALQEELRTFSYHLLVATSQYQQETEYEQIRALVSRGADGLILIGHDRLEEARRFIRERKLPTLVAWANDPDAELPSVGFDNRGAMKGITNEALRLGHRRFGIITAPTETNDRTRNRVAGAMDALTEANIPKENINFAVTPYGIETAARAFDDVMFGETPPTCLICGNDVLAVGAIVRARELGIRVPEDLSVTGFDDIELASIVAPALTTVHVPHRQIGHASGKLLVDAIENGSSLVSNKLLTRLVIRDSLGPPKDT